jgi:hypothetical protein
MCSFVGFVGMVQHPLFTLSEENRKKAMEKFGMDKAMATSFTCALIRVRQPTYQFFRLSTFVTPCVLRRPFPCISSSTN